MVNLSDPNIFLHIIPVEFHLIAVLSGTGYNEKSDISTYRLIEMSHSNFGYQISKIRLMKPDSLMVAIRCNTTGYPGLKNVLHCPGFFVREAADTHKFSDASLGLGSKRNML